MTGAVGLVATRVIWLNGPFGAGKTTTARLLAARLPHAHLFDAEYVGYMLRHVLDGPRPVRDFKEWPAWRRLVVETASALAADLDGDLVIPQAVFDETIWAELVAGFSSKSLELRAFTLDVEPVELERRIRTDAVETTAVDWRLSEMVGYRSARQWLARNTELIDTTSIEAGVVAERIALAVEKK